MKFGALARRTLDQRLDPFRALAAQPQPPRGWIRAVRDALGMSSTELAARMGISQSGIPALERAEVDGSLKLDRLRRAAAALDCDLVYALVPRTSLEESVQRRAHTKAAAYLARVDHTMMLEDQRVADDAADRMLAEVAAGFVDKRGLWTDPVQ